MNEQFIQTIIQGGGVGIAVLLILYSAWKDRMYNRVLSNHLDHMTNAMEKNAVSNERVTGVLERVVKIMERIEHRLDK